MIYNNLAIIVAISKNGYIGKNNKLLFHLPDDLRRFRNLTNGKTVVMGRNTYLSLPNGALTNRRNIVISDLNDNFENCEMVSSIPELLDIIGNDNEVFIIGGGMIYKQFYNLISKLYLTVVNKEYDGDVKFPDINYNDWNIDFKEEHYDANNDFTYSYMNLSRK